MEDVRAFVQAVMDNVERVIVGKRATIELMTAPDVVTLTRAFVEARYSQRSLSEQEANVVRRVWLRVRATLARRRRSHRSSPNTQEESHELAR